jgi:hypothetical protein
MLKRDPELMIFPDAPNCFTSLGVIYIERFRLSL